MKMQEMKCGALIVSCPRRRRRKRKKKKKRKKWRGR
jgi:hypothetical protein